jgi:hypothetical protein
MARKQVKPTITEDKWEVLIMGDEYNDDDLFEEIAKINDLLFKSEITDDEADKMVSAIEDKDDEFGLEISVIRKDYEHGHESYGWGGQDKIILWDSGGVAGNEMYTGDIHWCRKAAQLLCDNMNKENM